MKKRILFALALVLGAFVLAAGAALPVAAAGRGIDVETLVSSSYGTFNGIAYVKHEGRFWGTTANDFSVPFEIIAPADPAKGNGIMVLEPFHPFAGSPGGKYLTPEFLFGRGFSHATIRWYPDDVDPFAGYSIEDAVETLHNFAVALRQDPIAQGMVGTIEKLYGLAVSKTCEPLHTLIHSPGKGLFDLTLLFVPTWTEETHAQPSETKFIMVFLTEMDIVDSPRESVHTDAMRGSSPTYRSYEVAGAPHIPDLPFVRTASAAYGLTSEGTTPLDWTPVARALFVAGHRWATEGTEPPPSTYLAEAPEGQIDPVYQSRYGLELVTGIARDENGNALGGIRLPDVELGRGRFIALDPASFYGMGVFGAFEDLKCVPRADGTARFADHQSYVSQFTEQAQKLVAAGFLLSEDAEHMIAEAEKSEVGKPSACLPVELPVTGGMESTGGHAGLLVLAGLILTAAGIGLRRWVGAYR